GLGDEVTCVFTNDDKPAHLTLIKHVDGDVTPNKAAELAELWVLSATNSNDTVANASGGSTDRTEVDAGEEFTISEECLAGFDSAGEYSNGAWACYPSGQVGDENASIALTDSEPGSATLPALSIGDDVTCVITNTHD